MIKQKEQAKYDEVRNNPMMMHNIKQQVPPPITCCGNRVVEAGLICRCVDQAKDLKREAKLDKKLKKVVLQQLSTLSKKQKRKKQTHTYTHTHLHRRHAASFAFYNMHYSAAT